MTESMLPPTTPAGDISDNDKLMAALAYFFAPIVGIIILLVDTMKVRPYQKYHAIQSIGLLVAEMVLFVVVCILATICGTVLAATVVLAPVAICLSILPIIVFIPQLYYTYLAYAKPSYFEIPTLTKFMTQQGWLKV